MIIDLDQFVKELEPYLSSDYRIAVVADNDIDGIFSAVKFDQMLFSHRELEIEPFFRDEESWEIPLAAIQTVDPDVVLFLDIAAGSSPTIRRLIKKPRHGFSIDHHILTPEEDLAGLATYNPCSQGQLYWPTVHLSDQVLQKLFDIEPFNISPLLSFIGIVADAGIGYEANQFIIEAGLEPVYRWALQNKPKYLEVLDFQGFRIPYAHHLVILFNNYLFEKGSQEANIQLINSSESPSGVEAFLAKIEQLYAPGVQDLYALVQSILEQAPESEPILMYENTDKTWSNSDLARLLVERAQKPVIIYSEPKVKTNGIISVSGRAPRRSETRVDLLSLFRKYGGGGHERAVGLRIPSAQLTEFLSDADALSAA